MSPMFRVMVVACALVALAAPAALGHAKLLKTDPKRDAVLAKPPAVIRAWFNEELDAKRSKMTVSDAKGRRVDDGKGGVDLNDLDRKSLRVRVKPLAPGTYTVRYEAVSADDRFVRKGSFRFTVRKT